MACRSLQVQQLLRFVGAKVLVRALQVLVALRTPLSFSAASARLLVPP